MKKPLVLSFKRMSDIDLQLVCYNVGHSLIDNEYLPDASAYGKEIADLSDQLMQAIYVANLRDLLKITQKNQLREVVINKLRIVGEYVIEAAQGDETILLSSGFPMAVHKGQTIIDKPQNFKVLPGLNNGEILMQIKRIAGAKAYMYQYTPDPLTQDSKWETVFSTRCKKTLTRLPLGVKLWFRMGVVGPYDQVVYTEVRFRYVA